MLLLPSPKPAAWAYWALSVRDDGVGIDAAALPRVFDPFFTTKEADQGSGLGLSMVHLIAKRHGGYSRGFVEFTAVKPVFIAGEYQPCAVTTVPARNHADITDALRRACHAIEFTAHLQDNLEGLKAYLLDKVERYALLLEST